ncbi:MAG: ATP-binding protein [Pseudomonadota bacterium]
MPVRIEDITDPVTALEPTLGVSAAIQVFQSYPERPALPVVRNGVPLGLLLRDSLTRIAVDTAFQSPSLPVSAMMVDPGLLVEMASPAAYVASEACAAGTTGLRVGLIAVEDGRYAGMVLPERLLKAVAEENAARARAMKVQARRLEVAKARAEETMGEQSRFLAFLSHEIRTPLTGVLGIADLIGDLTADDTVAEYAETISDSGRLLDRLLGDLLDLSRLEAGKLQLTPEPFELSRFAKETRALWQGRSDAKGIALKVSLDDKAAPRIEADAMRLRQILFNLVSNAVKFTDAGTVTADLQVEDGPAGTLRLVMAVADTGVGIADEDKTRLFQAFEQASPETVRRFGGTGLGLSIAKGLVQKMGGRIVLSDNPGGGTIFTVTCPVRRAGPRLAVQNQRRRATNFKLGRILVAEDHAVTALVVNRALVAAGWSVECVATAEEAHRRLSNEAYQAALVDLHLGSTSGLTLVQHVRAGQGPNSSVPLLAMSAAVGESVRAACLRAGVDAFIEKPIRPRVLVGSLLDAIVEAQTAEPLPTARAIGLA